MGDNMENKIEVPADEIKGEEVLPTGDPVDVLAAYDKSDYAITLDHSKKIYSIFPLNEVAKEWLDQNVDIIIDTSNPDLLFFVPTSLMSDIKKMIDSEFNVDIWTKTTFDDLLASSLDSSQANS